MTAGRAQTWDSTSDRKPRLSGNDPVQSFEEAAEQVRNLIDT